MKGGAFCRALLIGKKAIFGKNRRLDLTFPSNPGITFVARTKMTG